MPNISDEHVSRFNNVYLIHPTQILTDWKLIVIVFVIVSVAVLLLLLGEAIPFLRRIVVLKDDPEHGDRRNVRILALLSTVCCASQ